MNSDWSPTLTDMINIPHKTVEGVPYDDRRGEQEPCRNPGVRVRWHDLTGEDAGCGSRDVSHKKGNGRYTYINPSA